MICKLVTNGTAMHHTDWGKWTGLSRIIECKEDESSANCCMPIQNWYADDLTHTPLRVKTPLYLIM